MYSVIQIPKKKCYNLGDRGLPGPIVDIKGDKGEPGPPGFDGAPGPAGHAGKTQLINFKPLDVNSYLN